MRWIPISKAKVIDAVFLLQGEKKTLQRVVYITNSIDSLILDMQVLYPDAKINRESVLSWKFVTVAEMDKINKEMAAK